MLRRGRLAGRSSATNLVPADENGVADIFVHDTKKGGTTRLSVSTDGNEASAFCDTPSVSGNGRYFAFVTDAGNLVDGDTNGLDDIFLHRP